LGAIRTRTRGDVCDRRDHVVEPRDPPIHFFDTEDSRRSSSKKLSWKTLLR